jgi:hypothetical protein
MSDTPNAPQDRSATLRDLATAVQQVTDAIVASEARAAEHARDLQTELLTGMEAFARGNFTRFHTLEKRVSNTDSNVIDNNDRLAALEERVLYLETRRPH